MKLVNHLGLTKYSSAWWLPWGPCGDFFNGKAPDLACGLRAHATGLPTRRGEDGWDGGSVATLHLLGEGPGTPS